MIDTNSNDPVMREIRTLVMDALLNKELNILNNRLYIFGIHDRRHNDVYISPNIPHAQEIVNFLEQYNISVSMEEVGNPAPVAWVALKKTFRTQHTKMAARICLLALLTLNDLVTW